MQKTRIVLIASIAAAAIAVLVLLHTYGFQRTFSFWNVRTYGIPFLDLRLITGSAEKYAQGLDPAINNPGDPLQRVFNYPKIWYPILASGINESWTVPLGVAIIALFLISVCVFPGRLTRLSVGLLVLAIVSPASMLAFARVNVDMLMFAFMTLSLALVTAHAAWALIVLLIAILLKIIPVLGLAAFLGPDWKRSLKYAGGILAFTVAYFAVTWNDMVFIFTHTQRGYEEAYGLAVLPAMLRQTVHAPMVRQGPAVFYNVVSAMDNAFLGFPALPYVAAGVILALALILGLQPAAKSEAIDTKNLLAFRMGALMYVGTFFLGNNWDYRLMFLLFTNPQLAEWAARSNRITRGAAIITVSVMLISLWHLLLQLLAGELFSLGGYAFQLVDEAANWILFAGLAYLFTCSLPDWLLSGARSLPGRFTSRARAAG